MARRKTIEEKFKEAVAQVRKHLDKAKVLADKHGIPFATSDDFYDIELNEKWDEVDSNVIESLTGVHQEPDGWSSSY